MPYQYIAEHDSPNLTKGRPGRITQIITHHWDDPDKQPTFDGTVGWLCTQAAESSAHYVVEAGKVACLVDPEDTAWHAGNFAVNQASIGIECNPRCSDADIETLAELIAELRDAYGDLVLLGHKDIVATECPGRYYPRLAEIDALARTKATTTPPAPKPPIIDAGNRDLGPGPNSSGSYHITEAGDTLWQFAQEWGPADPAAMLAAIKTANPGIVDPNTLPIGFPVYLPW